MLDIRSFAVRSDELSADFQERIVTEHRKAQKISKDFQHVYVCVFLVFFHSLFLSKTRGGKNTFVYDCLTK